MLFVQTLWAAAHAYACMHVTPHACPPSGRAPPLDLPGPLLCLRTGLQNALVRNGSFSAPSVDRDALVDALRAAWNVTTWVSRTAAPLQQAAARRGRHAVTDAQSQACRAAAGVGEAGSGHAGLLFAPLAFPSLIHLCLPHESQVTCNPATKALAFVSICFPEPRRLANGTYAGVDANSPPMWAPEARVWGCLHAVGVGGRRPRPGGQVTGDLQLLSLRPFAAEPTPSFHFFPLPPPPPGHAHTHTHSYDRDCPWDARKDYGTWGGLAGGRPCNGTLYIQPGVAVGWGGGLGVSEVVGGTGLGRKLPHFLLMRAPKGQARCSTARGAPLHAQARRWRGRPTWAVFCTRTDGMLFRTRSPAAPCALPALQPPEECKTFFPYLLPNGQSGERGSRRAWCSAPNPCLAEVAGTLCRCAPSAACTCLMARRAVLATQGAGFGTMTLLPACAQAARKA